MCRLPILATLLVCITFLAGQPAVQAENLKFVVTSSRLPEPAYLHSQAVYDGDDSVYIVGGRTSGVSDLVTKYSLSTGEVTIIGRYRTTIFDGAAIMDNDDIIHFGGATAGTISGRVPDIHRISTINGSSSRVNDLPVPSRGSRAAWDRENGIAYLFGGTGTSDRLRSILMYNASSSVLTQVGELPEGREFTGTAWDDEREMAYIFGDADTTLSQDILTFDPATGMVTKLSTKLPFSMRPNAVYSKEYNGRVIIFDTPGLVSFDPISHGVTQMDVDDWPRILNYPSCVYVPKLARIYIFGGQGSFGEETSRLRDEISYISLLGNDAGSTTTEQTTLEPTTEPEPPSTPQPSTLPPTEGPSTEAPFCPPSGVHNFPYPGNCTLYIRCFDGIEQIVSCAPLLFDEIDLICKPPSQAVCHQEIPINCPPVGYYQIPHPSSCSKYYECIEGKAYESLCAPSTYFDTTPDVMHCNLAELALCNAECPSTGIAFLPIRARDCKWYKVCVEGHSVNLECGRGEVYRPEEEKCVPDDAYACPYATAAAAAAEDGADEP